MSTGSLTPPPLEHPKPSIKITVKTPSAPAASSSGSSVSPIKTSPPSDPVNGSARHLANGHDHDHSPEKRNGHSGEKEKEKDQSIPERVQDDWQVAYTWAFIVKFKQLEKIRRLESLHDFEQCLLEPVAMRPDDILEGVLIQFLKNLKPGIRNLDASNIQSHLSAYIHTTLAESKEFTVWDRPWASNEEVRSGCCTSHPERMQWGRLDIKEDRVLLNPIRRIEQKGGGLFELDWRERAMLLRQLVDWQITHSEPIKLIIDREWKVKPTPKVNGQIDTSAEGVKIVPVGQDRSKTRVWSIDASGRMYRSGNPFKRPCPLLTITTTLPEFTAQAEAYVEYGSSSTSKPAGSGKGGKLTSSETVAYRKLIKGKEEEKALGEALLELVPHITKEDTRVARARKRIQDALYQAQQAEFRSTRTRRTTKKIDYTYGEGDDGDYGEDKISYTSRKRGAENVEYGEGLDYRGRPIIPGERKSARTAEYFEENGTASTSVKDEDGTGTGSTSASPAPAPVPVELGPELENGSEGYADVKDEAASTPTSEESYRDDGMEVDDG